MIKAIFLTIFTFSILALLATPVNACVCGGSPGVINSFASSHAVFIGKVVKIESVKRASVGFTLNEKDKISKRPKWVKSMIDADSVTFEVVESFRIITADNKVINPDKFQLLTGDGCGYLFEVGESYLVFADRIQPLLRSKKNDLPKDQWPEEMRLAVEADEFNKSLPLFGTSVCSETGTLKASGGKIEEIRNYLNPKPFGPVSTEHNAGVLNGRAISLPKPIYPGHICVTGTVVVQVIVDEKGEVITAEAVSGHALLRAASTAAALRAKFPPLPVKLRGVLVYNLVP